MDFISLKIIDIVDILLVAVLAYQVYKLIRGTSAMNIFFGIILIYFVWIVCRVLKLELLSLIIGQIMGVGVIALVVVFQPEIRHFLLRLGAKSMSSSSRYSISRWLFGSPKTKKYSKSIDEIVTACRRMSDARIGALIMIAHKSPLELFAETGDIIDASISARLIISIFFKNNPLHDGSMIIRNDRIYAARCVLPTSDDQNLPAQYGMRHRAAIGASQQTDAVIIVVSEETGSISYVRNGQIKYGISAAELTNLLISEE